MVRILLKDRLDRVHILKGKANERLHHFLTRMYIPRDAVISYVNGVVVDDQTYTICESDKILLDMVRAYQLPEYCRTLKLWGEDSVDDPAGVDSIYTKNILWYNDNGISELRHSAMNKYEVVDYVDEQFVQSVLSKKLINEGDTVLLALSGGRDSLALLYMLARNRDKLPKHKLVGVTVMDSAASKADLNLAREAVSALGVEDYTMLDLAYLEETMGYVSGFKHVTRQVFQEQGRGRSITLWHCIMRANVERFARERNIYKLAFGFHHEDLVASVLRSHTLGVLFGETVPEKTWGDFTIISPLWAITKKELTLYLQQVAPTHHAKQGSPTDYDRGDHNRDINYFLADMIGMIHPGFGFLLFDSVESLCKNYKIEPPVFSRCNNCGITFSDAFKQSSKKKYFLCSHCSFLSGQGEVMPLQLVQ